MSIFIIFIEVYHHKIFANFHKMNTFGFVLQVCKLKSFNVHIMWLPFFILSRLRFKFIAVVGFKLLLYPKFISES